MIKYLNFNSYVKSQIMTQILNIYIKTQPDRSTEY